MLSAMLSATLSAMPIAMLSAYAPPAILVSSLPMLSVCCICYAICLRSLPLQHLHTAIYYAICYAFCLRTSYALPGTNAAYAATRSSSSAP
eukprot:3727593-Rhodomonas_salina.1